MTQAKGGEKGKRKGPNPYGPPTEKQIRLLRVLAELIEERGGLAPTYRELCVRAGLSNHRSVSQYVGALLRKGLVAHNPASFHRSLTITEAGAYLLSGGALDYTPIEEMEEEEQAEVTAPDLPYPFVTLRAR